jgi:hypothetical protein
MKGFESRARARGRKATMSIRAVYGLIALSLWGAPRVARAEPNSCQSGYEQAQERRSSGRLKEARTELERCVEAACPEFVREDCARWLSVVESALPSIVLSATRDGKDLSEVEVFVGDEQLVSALDGKAIPVNPGRYELRFVAPGLKPVNVSAVVKEGEKSRAVVAVFESEPPPPARKPPPAPPSPVASGPSPAVYVLSGVGVLGLGAFATFGVLGNTEKAAREGGCAPHCSDADLTAIRTRYLLADVSLGLGVAALGVAGYLFFTERRESKPDQAVAFDLAVSPDGARTSVRTVF